MYCIYTDKDVPSNKGNFDHVIPMSLGGRDEFVVWSDRHVNSALGSEVDGKLGQDPLLRIALRNAGVKGHSGKEPTSVWRNSQINGRPAQVTWGKKKVTAWDAIDRRELAEKEFVGKEISAKLHIDLHVTTRFIAKVALGAGYFIYGDAIRSALDCEALRELALLPFQAARKSSRISNSEIMICDRFHPDSRPGQPGYLNRVAAENTPRSIVISVPHDDAVSFHVGLVGMYIGSIIIPATTESLPKFGEHDLGHVLILAPGPVERRSYRSFMLDLYNKITDR